MNFSLLKAFKDWFMLFFKDLKNFSLEGSLAGVQQIILKLSTSFLFLYLCVLFWVSGLFEVTWKNLRMWLLFGMRNLVYTHSYAMIFSFFSHNLIKFCGILSYLIYSRTVIIWHQFVTFWIFEVPCMWDLRNSSYQAACIFEFF